MYNKIKDWIEAGASPEEGRQLLLLLIENPSLKNIIKKQLGYQEQIIKVSLAYRVGFNLPEKLTFRQEFPFLNLADCPIEMKILAANKLTAYHNFKEAHKALFNCISANDQFLTAKRLTENFVDNQLIWKELNHYKENGSILGKHPVFRELNKIKALRKLSPIALIEHKVKVEHNIWRIESELMKNNKPHLRVDREKRLQLRKSELAEINRLIDSYR